MRDACGKLHVCGNPNGMCQIHTNTNTIQICTNTIQRGDYMCVVFLVECAKYIQIQIQYDTIQIQIQIQRGGCMCVVIPMACATASPSAPLVKTFAGQSCARYVSILSPAAAGRKFDILYKCLDLDV